MTSSIPQCWKCKYYKTKLRCDAFKEIPIEIYKNKVSHRKNYEGDNGIRFEPIEEKESNA